jgi:hypothetical protein
MTTGTLLRREHFPNVGEARLVEAEDRVPIERPFVTGVAIAVLHFLKSEVDRSFA